METILAILIIVTLLFFGATTICELYIRAQTDLAQSWQITTQRAQEQSATSIAVTAVEGTGDHIHITIRNTGNTRLADYEQWDMIVQYTGTASSYTVLWLPNESLAQGNVWWSIEGIYIDASTLTPEAFEPDILNPGEEIVLEATLSRSMMPSTPGMVTVGTPTGRCSSAIFVAS